MKHSEKLQAILNERSEAAFDCAHSTLDDDNFTLFEAFGNGVELAKAAGSREIFYATVTGFSGRQFVAFLFGESEDAVCEEASTWDKDGE